MKLCSIKFFSPAGAAASLFKAAAVPVIAFCTVIGLTLASMQDAGAQLRLPSLFGNGMVLQQSSEAAFWGWDNPGTEVTVTASWDGKACTAVAGPDGRWQTEVSTPAAGGPYTVTVSGSSETVIKGVLAGEVWICSGQSNMAMPVRGYTSQPVENSYSIILEAPAYRDRVHIFTVSKDSSSVVQTDCKGKWAAASCKSVASASAVAYQFAVRLTEALGVPVGIIVSAYGGTKIEPWTPADDLRAALDGKISRSRLDKKFTANVPGKKPSAPGTLYNSMIAPLAPYTAAGFLWYQGCSSRKDYDHYADMQAAMVAAWREAWGGAEMPFIFATIAPHAYGNADDIVRPLFVENQLKSLAMIPASHAVITEGFGEKDCIHPSRKGPVADQMAWTAMSEVYGMEGITSGFLEYDWMEINGDVVTVFFKNARFGLCPSYGEPVKGFRLAGKDKVFHEAEAVVLGNPLRVEVRSTDVKAPVAVRYSFLNWCESNLTDLFGVPVPPFRSDDWQ